MEKLYTKIIGVPVYSDSSRPITTVKDILIDPETGKLCALEVNSGTNMVISPMDIIAWRNTIIINNLEDIVKAEEILRVDEIIKQDIRIYRNHVESRNGTHIGRVYDFGIDSVNLCLKNLYVAKDIFGLVRYDKRIIRSKDIEEILKHKIIIKDDKATLKAKKNEDLSIEGMAKA